MKDLKQLTEYYYNNGNYNCAETIIHAANECYGLEINEEDMKMFGGFGSGMYAGLVCGALAAGVAVLSKLIIEDKAKDNADEVRRIINGFVRTFKERLRGTSCRELRPLHFSVEERCLKTVLLAAEVLDEKVKEVI